MDDEMLHVKCLELRKMLCDYSLGLMKILLEQNLQFEKKFNQISSIVHDASKSMEEVFYELTDTIGGHSKKTSVSEIFPKEKANLHSLLTHSVALVETLRERLKNIIGSLQFDDMTTQILDALKHHSELIRYLMLGFEKDYENIINEKGTGLTSIIETVEKHLFILENFSTYELSKHVAQTDLKQGDVDLF